MAFNRNNIVNSNSEIDSPGKRQIPKPGDWKVPGFLLLEIKFYKLREKSNENSANSTSTKTTDLSSDASGLDYCTRNLSLALNILRLAASDKNDYLNGIKPGGRKTSGFFIVL